MSQAVLEPVSSESAPSTQPAAPASERGPRWLPPLVLLAAIGLAAGVFAWFCQHSRDLWWWMGHDRHAHYMYGLNLAMDLRAGDFGRLFSDFDKIRVWGPLHPVLIAMLQLVAGPDHRLAVLPSLAGWVLAIWCAFLIPRRLLTSGGNAAGLLAAAFIAVSPAHRAFATDCMYESLGAGLSLAVVYLYLVAVQEQTRRAGILLGVALSALFLHKYNYWLLITIGLFIGEFARQPRAWLQYAWSLCQRDRLPAWIIGELKQPLNYVALALAGAALYVALTGGGTIVVGSREISVQEPHNLVHFAYIALFIRLAWWYRQTGRAWSLTLPETVRNVLLWHGGAIALWFLWPKRLSYFLWFLSPFNTDQRRESVPFMHGAPYYLQGVQNDYLTFDGGIYLLVGMLLMFALAWRQLKPGAAALVCFFLVGAYLSCQHPMLKYRFIHSWIAASYVLGAIGLIHAVQTVVGWVSPTARPWGVAGACAVLAGVLSFAVLEPGHAQESGIKSAAQESSPLRITETYLPALAEAKHPTIVSNVSARFLWTWTFIEHHGHHRMAAEIKNFKTFDGNPDAAKRWLETTNSDALVLIDIRKGSTYDWPTDEYVDLAAFHQALAGQTTWTQAQRWEMPEGVTITLWHANREAAPHSGAR